MSADRTASWMSSPWLTIWFKPQITINRVTQTNDIGSVLFLGAAAGVVWCVQWIGFVPLRDKAILAIAFLAGPAIGLIKLCLASALYTLSGRCFGGVASFRQMCSAYAWSVVPMSLWLVVLLGAFFYYGAPFLSVLSREDGQEATMGYGLAFAAMCVASIWSFVTFVRTCGAVQNFGVLRSIATLLAPTLVLVVIAFSIRSFVAQPFNMPARSMSPSLLVGDHFLADKMCYGYSKFTSPLMPDFSGRIWQAAPHRGDIVVFKLPKDNKTDYVKRIVGLPGDEIELKDGILSINGTSVPRKQVEDFIDDTGRYKQGIRAYEEMLPNGVRYTVLDLDPNGPLDNAGPFNVPAGRYFVLGDNRDNSIDSRTQDQLGYVPEENLLGCASVFYFSAVPFPKNNVEDCWFCNIRFERFWQRVR